MENTKLSITVLDITCITIELMNLLKLISVIKFVKHDINIQLIKIKSTLLCNHSRWHIMIMFLIWQAFLTGLLQL